MSRYVVISLNIKIIMIFGGDNMKDKRKSILQATASLIQEGGRELKIQEVAKRAEIGKGTVYEYFNSKEDLIFQTMLFMGTELINFLREQVLDPNKNFQESMRSFIRIQMTSISKFINYYMILEQNNDINSGLKTIEDFKPSIIDRKKNVLEVLNKVIEKGLEEGVLNSEVDKDFCNMIPHLCVTSAIINSEFNLISSEERSEDIQTKDIEKVYKLIMKILK